MPFFSPDVVDQVRQIDLLTHLQTYEPQELVYFSGHTSCTKTHDSLKTSNGKWCWWSRGIGGTSALDYLIKVRGLSFTDAMQTLVGGPARFPSALLPRRSRRRRSSWCCPSPTGTPIMRCGIWRAAAATMS